MILETLRLLVVIQTALLAVLLLASFGHSATLDLLARHRRPRRQVATGALAQLLVTGAGTDAAVAALRALPMSERSEVLSAVAGNLRGDQRTELTRIAELTGVVEHARRWTRSRRPGIRLRGVRSLRRVGATPPDVVALLTDRWPPVRAEASRLAVGHPDPAAVRELIARLADPEAAVRFAAKDALVRCGVAAADAVTMRLRTDELEPDVRAALLAVTVHIAEPAYLPLAHRFARDEDARIRAEAARLSAAIGSREGVAVLATLIADPDERVRAAAVEGYGQLGYWPAAPTVAARLSDSAWRVRRAAGGALRRLGAPGLLYLRRTLDDTDPYARDMARQVLDLPELRVAG